MKPFILSRVVSNIHEVGGGRGGEGKARTPFLSKLCQPASCMVSKVMAIKRTTFGLQELGKIGL